MERLSDDGGSVSFGWVSADVFLSRFNGELSSSLCSQHLSRLQAAVERGPVIRYFSDFGALTSYDLLARSALVRLVLASRRKFTELVILTWGGSVSSHEQALVEALGEPVQVVRHRSEFERQLLLAAPRATRSSSPPPITPPRNLTPLGQPTLRPPPRSR